MNDEVLIVESDKPLHPPAELTPEMAKDIVIVEHSDPVEEALRALGISAFIPRFGLSRKEAKRYEKHQCTQCGAKIGPGRDGRKCKTCRDVLIGTPDEERWEGMQPSVEILDGVCPEIADWVNGLHDNGRVVFVDSGSDPHMAVQFLAQYDFVRGRLSVGPGFFAEPDGSAAAILAHEYRHYRQRTPKRVLYTLSYLFNNGGDKTIVENDAIMFEQEARAAIFGSGDEALDSYLAALSRD